MSAPTTNNTLWTLAIILSLAAGAAYFFKEKVRTEYESRLEMPIVLSYRTALMGPGLVITLKNTSTRHLAVVTTLVNPTLNKKESYRIDISPSTIKEIGHAEGWTFASGDIIKIVHDEYKTIVQKLP